MGVQGNIIITVKYVGVITPFIGKREETMEVPGDFQSLLKSVRNKIERQTEGKLLYAFLYNGVAINRIDQESTAINDGDVITVVPIVLGG